MFLQPSCPSAVATDADSSHLPKQNDVQQSRGVRRADRPTRKAKRIRRREASGRCFLAPSSALKPPTDPAVIKILYFVSQTTLRTSAGS